MAVADALELLVLLDGAAESPTGNVRAVYDRGADVLYVNFNDPPEAADDSDMDEQGVITRWAADGRVVGYTYLNASRLLAERRAA